MLTLYFKMKISKVGLRDVGRHSKGSLAMLKVTAYAILGKALSRTERLIGG